MATPTYDLIASQVLSTSAASVTFSSIPATYRDLVLVVDANLTTSDTTLDVRFNSDSGSNYSIVYAQGNGSTTASGTTTATYLRVASVAVYLTSATKMLSVSQIMDYSATDKHKSVLMRSNNAAQGTDMRAGRWASTSAINAIEIFSGASFASGSTFYLFGIAS